MFHIIVVVISSSTHTCMDKYGQNIFLSDECILSNILPRLDQVCWLTQEDPVMVHVRQTPSRSPDDVFDSVQVDLSFSSGATATIEVNRERAANDDQLEVGWLCPVFY